jgi:hypothetical protein
MNQIYLLTDAQRRIWYTESFFTHTGVSNLVAKTKLKDWDHSLLEQSIEIFVTHFEMMRVRLLSQEGKEPVQYISKESSVKLPIVDISVYKAEQVKDWFQNQAKVPFSLYDSCLYDFQVVKWEKDVFLFMRCHHILFDGISGNLIVKKIQEIYEGLQQGISLDLGNPYKFNQYHRSAEEYLASVRFQTIMGMFVNTIVMRNQPEPHKQLIDFVKEVKEGALAAYEHADYPFERLVEKLPLVPDTSRNPLFLTMFSMQDFGRNILSFDRIEDQTI